MRTSGIVSCAQGLTPYGHLCWAYRDSSEFRERAAEYIKDGLAAGQRVEYVGSKSAAALRDELATLDGKELAGAEGIGVSPADDFYACPQSGLVDPDRAAEAAVTATEQALAAGYTGFRAVVDCTEVARTKKQREAFARYEHLIDQKMSVLPVAALCAYSRTELGNEAVAEMASLHPLVNNGCTSFRVYSGEDISLALAGEIDGMCAGLLGTTLGRCVSVQSGPEIAIDGRELTFIDHRGLLTLDTHAANNDLKLVLYTGSEAVMRVAKLLPLSSLRVEQSAGG
jgi:anti-anti-sigma regulatory factor